MAHNLADMRVFYDRLSRFALLRNLIKYGNPYASFAMHKLLNLPVNTKGSRFTYVDDIALSAVDLPLEPRVLDAGSGFGGTIFRWYELVGGRYDGITLSQVQLAIARKEARRRGIHTACRFYRRDYDTPFLSSYDAVVAIESLVHSENLEGTVEKLTAVLKPGGYMVVVDDVLADIEAAVSHPELETLRHRWQLTNVPTEKDYRMAFQRNNLRMVHEADLSDQVDLMSPRSLRFMNRICQFLYATVPLSPIRTVLSAQIGGFVLQRLYGSSAVRYKLFAGRKVSGQTGSG